MATTDSNNDPPMVARDYGNIFSTNKFLTLPYDSERVVKGKPHLATMGATTFLASDAHKDIIIFMARYLG